MSGGTLYYDGIFHTGVSENDSYGCMEVKGGKIVALYKEKPKKRFNKEISLAGQHAYPCLIDGHTHPLLSVAVMAMGMNLCEITGHGVEPSTMQGVEAKIRAYASRQKKDAVIAINNYIMSAIDAQRLPSRTELDAWAEGRAVVVYNIDGHSTAVSSEVLRLLDIEPEGHSGVFQGEENERVQGRITDIVGARMNLRLLSRGAAEFQNACAAYGIGMLGGLAGNGDSPKDSTTDLIVQLARRFDLAVKFYFQYIDIERAARLSKFQKAPAIGGCGDWEMDGAIGAHSAAFDLPYTDSGETAPCYYNQQQIDKAVQEADARGFQIACHAIGTTAIKSLLQALRGCTSGKLHRIEHCEFPDEESLAELKKGKYALMMQPGYAWIDKRYLHTYSRYLPEELICRQRFGSLYRAGVCVCGSSDSPVQELDPYLQMLGMVQHYIEEESVSVYEAFRCYTINPARAMLCEDERGSLEAGKQADFFTADRDLFSLSPEELPGFRPTACYYGGRLYKQKKGTVTELLLSFLKKPKKV